MSENSNNTKMIVNELKELKNSINTLNLILISSDIGINLKTHTNYEVNENLLPKYKNFIVWITIRQIIVFATLYSLINYNIKYSKFISAFTANAIGFPIRIFALKKSYPKLNFTLKNIKKSGLLEIIKSSIGDGSTLYLIYNFKYSPFKV